MKAWRREMWTASIMSALAVFATTVGILVGEGAEGYVGVIFWGAVSVICLGQIVLTFRDRELCKRLEEFDKRKAQVWNDILTNDFIDEATRARQIQTMIGIEERTK